MKQLKLLACAALMALAACSSGSAVSDKAPYDLAKDSRSVSINDGWRFNLGDDTLAINAGYDDTDWRLLNLPHDWAIEGDFSEDNPSGTGGGALPGGIGWYRKNIDIPLSDKGKSVYIDFDGVYMNSTVYVNGHELGTRPYGYASFSYDITPYVNFGGDNVVAVRVDNAEQPNSRWYSGCGIYRNVWLRTLNPVHIAKNGTFITTGDITVDNVPVKMDITIEGLEGAQTETYTVASVVYDPQGRKVADADCAVDAAGVVTQTFDVANPMLWSTDSPNLYKVVTRVKEDGKVVDEYESTFGVRSISFDPDKGFALNGKPMKINGVCMHHDLGALGAAINTRAIERQLEIMQQMGVNAIRCSHNPPSPELLALCDRMGLLVMDETFDMWRRNKTSHDYARYFDQWHERDMTDQIIRDRNHPSIVMWSIGNEVLEQWSSASADTLSLEEANMILNFGHSADQLAAEGDMSVNSLLTRKLADMTRSLDPTRPITAGCNEPNPGNHLFRSGALDIIGYNYHNDWFDDVPTNFPGKPFIITESVSGLMTRGYYRMPSDSMYVWPVRWDIPFSDPSFACSSYDNCHVPWGTNHERTMIDVKNNDFISGQFIWTGFDYIGEPTPFGWPARSSYFGIVDLAGFPKDVYYMYQSEWCPDQQVMHLFPHWTWQEGDTVDMWCYYNNADEVELYINGESQGVSSKTDDRLHAMWRVTYVPGEVTAVARRNGTEVARQSIATAGDPAAIRLTPDRSVIRADGHDLSFITVEIVDKDGNLCPWADDEVTFAVSGVGFNAGVDNGNPISLERFKDNKRKAHYGKALLIVQNDGNSGDITINATAPGLTSAQTRVSAK